MKLQKSALQWHSEGKWNIVAVQVQVPPELGSE